MRSITAHALVASMVVTPSRRRRAAVILPFFTPRLDVRLLVVVYEDGVLQVIHDPPSQTGRRMVSFAFEPRREVDLSSLQSEQMEPLLHFDPWWLLRHRREIPDRLRKTILEGNIAAMRIDGRAIRTIVFDRELMRVTGAVVRRRVVGRRLVDADTLVDRLDLARA